MSRDVEAPDMIRTILRYLVPLVVCFGVGFSASLFQADAIADWYPYLDKPALTPPNMAFPVAWGILYICMAVSVGLVSNTPPSRRRNLCIVLFAVQLALNFLWSILFFFFRSPAAGMVCISALAAVLVVYAVKSLRVSPAASALFWPYILWVLFACYLNAYILLYN